MDVKPSLSRLGKNTVCVPQQDPEENVWPKKDEETGGCRTLHNKKLHNLFFSSDIVRMIKSRRMWWLNHVACMGEMRNLYRILVAKSERKPRHM
jgi:hypothetical protein